MDIKKEKKEEGKMMEQKDGKEGRPWKRPNFVAKFGGLGFKCVSGLRHLMY
jgi:hypothetical protein